MMGKRSSFDRIPRDFYPTPPEAVAPLIPHLEYGTSFAEPCAGDGALIRALESAGMSCVDALDIEPRTDIAWQGDALDWHHEASVDAIITNPPWARNVLHPMIQHFARSRPTWLLFDADWMHTRQSAPFMPILRKVVSVGRIKWIADSPFTGKDNACWYLFDANKAGPAEFIGRAA